MTTCTGFYYTKPAWHKDPIKHVKGVSTPGGTTLGNISKLDNDDAMLFQLALETIMVLEQEKSDARHPFGCAEVDAVYQLLKDGVDLNRIFPCQAYESRIKWDPWAQETIEDEFVIRPCRCCRMWLSSQDRSGCYTIDMRSIYMLAKQNTHKLKRLQQTN